MASHKQTGCHSSEFFATSILRNVVTFRLPLCATAFFLVAKLCVLLTEKYDKKE